MQMNRIIFSVLVTVLMASLTIQAQDAYEIGTFESIGVEQVYKTTGKNDKSTFYIPAGWCNGVSYLAINETELPKFIILLHEMKDYISSHESNSAEEQSVDMDIPQIGKSVTAEDYSELGKNKEWDLDHSESEIGYCGIDNITNKEKIEFVFHSVRDKNNPDNFSNRNYGYLHFYSPEQIQKLIDVLKTEMNTDKSNNGLNANTVKRYGKWRDYDDHVLSYTTPNGKRRFYIQTASNLIDIDEIDINNTTSEYLWFAEDKLPEVLSLLSNLNEKCKELDVTHKFQGTGRTDIYQSNDNDFILLTETTQFPINGIIVGKFGNSLDIRRGNRFNGNADIYFQQHKNGGKWLRLEMYYNEEDGDESEEILTIELPDLEKLVSILKSIKLHH